MVTTAIGLVLLEASDWHGLREKDELGDDQAIRKGYLADIEILKQQDGEASRDIRFVVSTEAVDRDRDIVASKGWDLEHFKENPVVLWAHDHRNPPIAFSPDIGIKSRKLQATARFADAETHPFADTIFRLVKGGFLRATSIGFLPKEWTFDEERRGVNFLKNELLEFSVVNVPANPEALIAARASGISLKPMVLWAEEIIDTAYEQEHGLYLPRPIVERAHAIAAGEPVSVQIAGDIEDAVAEDVATKLGIQLVRADMGPDGEIRVFQPQEPAAEPGDPEPTPEPVRASVDECGACGGPHTDLEARPWKGREAFLQDGSPVTHYFACPKDGGLVAYSAPTDKGTVPRDVSRQTAPEDTAWSRPRLQDFTDEPFDELSAAQRRRIAGHFAWTEVNPPMTFGQLKLPHHRASDGWVILRGVNAAMGVLLGARGGVDVPDADRRPIFNHLASHLRQYDREPPEFRFVEGQVLRTMPDLFEWDEEEGKLSGPDENPESDESTSGADLLLGLSRESGETEGGDGDAPIDLLKRAGPELISRALESVVDNAVKGAIAARTGRLPD